MTKCGTGPSAGGGFTLLEVMVTLLLIGVIVSFAVITIPGADSVEQVRRETRRLASLIELHRQEAILFSEQRGIVFTGSGYRFLRKIRNQVWRAGQSDRLWQFTLPDSIRLALIVDGISAVLSETAERPQVGLFSSGETTPFSVILTAAAADFQDRLSVDQTGRLDLHSGYE